jgi:hypothetical protein
MTTSTKKRIIGAGAAFAFALVLNAAPAQADRTVNANEPIVWFDDVKGMAKEIIFPREGSASDDNRSGLGDDTNAGMGDGTDNSTNEGTDNPNQSSGPSSKAGGPSK